MDSYSCKSPVLFLVFNRPDVTKRVFGAIRQARAPRLYVAADGAREDREGEDQLVEETRRIATAVDWDCEVKTLFRDKNLGCGKAVSEGITWFFENEPEGIILEDDCLPSKSFFLYCDELLSRYRSMPNVASIAGDNSLGYCLPLDFDYDFSHIFHCWGWASWRRFWETIDKENTLVDAGAFRLLGDNSPARNLENQVKLNFSGQIDTWDYRVTYEILRSARLTCIPRFNLISNLGFDRPDAAHTMGPSGRASTKVFNFSAPIRHPHEVACNEELLQQWVELKQVSRWKMFLKRVIRICTLK